MRYLLIDSLKDLLRNPGDVLRRSFLLKSLYQILLRLTLAKKHNLLEDVDHLFEVMLADQELPRCIRAALNESYVLLHNHVVMVFEGEVLVAFIHWLLEFQVMRWKFENRLVLELFIYRLVLLLLYLALILSHCRCQLGERGDRWGGGERNF